ncbi:hypothetical protein CDAR_83711 [Caerostris darwini]|uniref:Retrovirus-related Pol polyprotein from transposon TNT 1-94 n=1 Tax=Caerostris darwini TaxID=1538125 RepID=A0AAV4SYP2_9ARAC|nr:retrovirus-related Pol polyprotein from transposon TNT 1-94 [Caerostris darwini]GIY58234.1 hypothetical protein CDAR_83711 [Caerostris darwini]
MACEIQLMKDREARVQLPAPKNSKVIGCIWVYTLKKNDKGVICRYKARLVAQGHNQRIGETYEETFSPVENFSLIRMFFVIFVGILKWTHCQLDIKCAYVYANLKECIYMKEPQGFIDPIKTDYVCNLKKAINGLHQSG